MNGQSQDSGGVYRLNYPGIIAGIALVVLPFLGAWWFFSLGTDAVVIAYSPFDISVASFGNEITSPLFASLNLALKIVIIYYGGLLIGGSVLRAREDKRSLSDFLVRVSARKFLWLVIFFVASVAVADFIINQAFALMGVHAQVPYFVGASLAPLRLGPVSLSVPVTQGFTGVFTIAVLVSILSLVAYIYQERFTLVKTEHGPRFRRIQGKIPVVPGGESEPVKTDGQDR